MTPGAIYDRAEMQAATEYLRRQARRIVDAALERVPLKAATLVGSAGRGDADFYSDLDLLLYVDELPPTGPWPKSGRRLEA
jgi:predicted nucleotidyltransferase